MRRLIAKYTLTIFSTPGDDLAPGVFKASEGLAVVTDETTVSGLFEKHFLTENLIKRVYGYIAVDKEIARRIAFIKKVEEIQKNRSEDEKENPLTEEELKKDF